MRIDLILVLEGDVVNSNTIEIGWRYSAQQVSALRWIRRHDPGANVTRFGHTALVTFTDRRRMKGFMSRLCKDPSITQRLAQPIRLKLRPHEMRNTNFDAVKNNRMRMALRRRLERRARPGLVQAK
jgi:hypothetical protein